MMILYPWAMDIMLNNSLVKILSEITVVIYRKWETLNDGHETAIIDERVKTFPTKDEAVKSATSFIENTEADASWVRHTAYIIPGNADGEKTAEFAIGDDYYS